MLKHFCGFYLVLSRLNIHKELPFTFLAGVVTTIKITWYVSGDLYYRKNKYN